LKITFFNLLFILSFSHAQTYFLLTDVQKKYIEYRSFSDELIDHPLYQPYSDLQITNILINDSTFLGQSINLFFNESPNPIKIGTTINGFIGKNNFLPSNEIGINIFGLYKENNIVAACNYRADSKYQRDEVYFGSEGKFGSKVVGRITDSYIQYQKHKIKLFYGRQYQNYGIINSSSLILSENPYSYDHFSFQYKTSYFRYSYLATRLEDKISYDIRNDAIQNEWHKRYFSFHRLEIPISNNLTFAFSESILYGGRNQNFLPMYMNPLNIYFVSKMVERKGLEETNANVLMAFDVLYKPKSNLVFYSQFLIDDMDFTKETRDRYPDRIGYLGKFVWLDPIPKTMLSVKIILMSNWTYNSYYTFGNYTYYGKSIGYPKNGIEKIELNVDTFLYDKSSVSMSIFLERERTQDLESHFIDQKTKFPIGVVQNVYGASVMLDYLYLQNSFISVYVDYLLFENYQNSIGIDKTGFNFQLRFHHSIMKSLF